MNEPAIDPVVFNEMSELMEDALGEFIESYLDNSHLLLQNITNALATENATAVFENAHQLKGGSGSIGAMRVFQLSMELEEKARSGETEGLNKLLNELQSAYGLAAQALEKHL